VWSSIPLFERTPQEVCTDDGMRADPGSDRLGGQAIIAVEDVGGRLEVGRGVGLLHVLGLLRLDGALIAALLVHRLLNAAEVAAIWQQGAFAFAGRIGRLAVVERRADLVPDPDRTRPPSRIREQVGCTGSAQTWVDAGTAASRRSIA
jgi:hypothetical protein